jgi:hypothetical protein
MQAEHLRKILYQDLTKILIGKILEELAGSCEDEVGNFACHTPDPGLALPLRNVCILCGKGMFSDMKSLPLCDKVDPTRRQEGKMTNTIKSSLPRESKQNGGTDEAQPEQSSEPISYETKIIGGVVVRRPVSKVCRLIILCSFCSCHKCCIIVYALGHKFTHIS